jgi:hypothetical protein
MISKISGSLLLLLSVSQAVATSPADGSVATIIRGGSIDGGRGKKGKRFSLNALRPPHTTFNAVKPDDGKGVSTLSMQQQPQKSKKLKMYTWCICIVTSWLALSTLFYSKFYNWPIPQSFFYAVDAGMSIGFCTEVKETEVASRAFTIVHILLGASCIGGVLVMLVNSILEGVYNRTTEMYKVIVERYSFDKAFKAGNGRISYNEFNNVLMSNGCILSEEELKKACSEYDLNSNGFIQYEDFDRIFDGIANIVPSSRFINSQWMPLRIAARVYDAVTSLFTDKNRRINILFIFWIAIGVLWGIRYGWDPITVSSSCVFFWLTCIVAVALIVC